MRPCASDESSLSIRKDKIEKLPAIYHSFHGQLFVVIKTELRLELYVFIAMIIYHDNDQHRHFYPYYHLPPTEKLTKGETHVSELDG